MLVRRRPRAMGSTQPPDINLPFGYTADASQEYLDLDFPCQDAPEPAPGQPLLNDNDTKFLTSFFEEMTADNYSTTSYGEGLNFSDEWLDMPPAVMGYSTSFGPGAGLAPLEAPGHIVPNSPYPELTFGPSSRLMPPPPPPPHAPPSQPHRPVLEQRHSEPTLVPTTVASADVLAAASVLQNGSVPRSSQEHAQPYAGQNMANMRASMTAPIRSQSLTGLPQEGRRLSQLRLSLPHENENMLTDMIFGSAIHQASTPRAQNPADLRWGSNSSFGQQAFMPASDKETSDSLVQERLDYMGCLEISATANSTRPSSPDRSGNGLVTPVRLKTRDPLTIVKVEEFTDGGPPHKRRKSQPDEEDEDDEEPSSAGSTKAPPSTVSVTLTPTSRKRLPKVEGLTGTTTVCSETPSRRRRKSTASGTAPKQIRENLTEEQKRENHIKSEQKRRTVIKEGFDELCELVPELKGGGFSKSTMLTVAAEWLEHMLSGNATLQAQLDEFATSRRPLL